MPVTFSRPQRNTNTASLTPATPKRFNTQQFVSPAAAAVNAVNNNAGVQSRLDETTFSQYLDGFQEVQAADLLNGAAGGRVRYVIDTVDAYGRVVRSDYRLGGWLANVDPQLRYLQLFNPMAKARWSVQLQKPGTRVRLYYMPRGTSDEVSMMRSLLEKLERGEIAISRMP